LILFSILCYLPACPGALRGKGSVFVTACHWLFNVLDFRNFFFTTGFFLFTL
jgi:hypothetical protein